MCYKPSGLFFSAHPLYVYNEIALVSLEFIQNIFFFFSVGDCSNQGEIPQIFLKSKFLNISQIQDHAPAQAQALDTSSTPKLLVPGPSSRCNLLSYVSSCGSRFQAQAACLRPQAKCPDSRPKLHTPYPGSRPQAKLQAQTPCPRLQYTNLSSRPRLEFLAQAPVPSPNSRCQVPDSRPQTQAPGPRSKLQASSPGSSLLVYTVSHRRRAHYCGKPPPPHFEKIWI